VLLAPLLLSAAAVAGQAPPATPAPQAPVVSHRLNRIFVSPMGEPFRPKDRDDDTLADWFHQADLNHDGQLSLEEMQKDAERFFGLLDVNHDGEIDPDEITRYETVVAPEISTAHLGFASMGEGGSGAGGHRRRGKGWSDEGYDDGHQGGARYGLLDLPEPVVSADTDFNRGVSLAEFRQAATQRFVALDVDHQGRLTLGVLETLKPPPPATGNQPQKQPPPLPDDADPGPGV
jgi:Ca2+-binding EF-hand superfamily protein